MPKTGAKPTPIAIAVRASVIESRAPATTRAN